MQRRILQLVLPSLISIGCYSQASRCANWPADCPDENSIENSQSVSVRLGNGLLKPEIEKQDTVRKIISGVMQDAAEALHWPLVELEEVTGLAGFQKGTTPEPLRSPRAIEFYFQYVANEDSLADWKQWKEEDQARRTTAGTAATQSYGQTVNSPQFKNYMDSSNHYRDLYIAYLEKHKNDGAAVLTDKTAEHYSKKMTEFSDKAVALQTRNIANNGWKQLENEDKQITHRYRNASIVYVRVAANYYNAMVNDEVNSITDYHLAGATIAKEGKIKEEENGYYHEYGQWDFMVMALLGNWLNKPVNGSYPAAFTLNGQGDDRTPKKISSEKIQTISLHIFGSKANVEKLAKQLDIQKMNAMIERH